MRKREESTKEAMKENESSNKKQIIDVGPPAACDRYTDREQEREQVNQQKAGRLHGMMSIS